MRRAAVGRDAGLTARILAVFALLGVSLVATAAGIAWLFFFLPTWWPLWTAVAVGLTISVVLQYGRAEESLLDVANAAIVDDETEPHLCNLVDRVAAMLDLPTPNVALSLASLPNGFATALTRRRAVVTITDEMRRKLDEHELETVIAHELAHIANRDAVVMTVASAHVRSADSCSVPTKPASTPGSSSGRSASSSTRGARFSRWRCRVTAST